MKKRPSKQGQSGIGLRVLEYVSALMILIAVVAFSYPTAANWIFQYNQSKIVANYDQQVSVAQPDKEEQRAQAHKYNDALTAGALLGANERIPLSDGGLDENATVVPYNQQLVVNDTGLMARIRIPSIDVDLPIYHGTSDDVLLKGVGHLEGSSLPVGGPGTHAVLTAHRGLASARLFTDLDELNIGDTFYVETFGEVLEYRVANTQVVEPEDTQSLRATPGKDEVTLVTCTPLGINSHRILVTGERVPEASAEPGEMPTIPTFPWWIVIDVACVLILIGYLIMMTRRDRRRASAD